MDSLRYQYSAGKKQYFFFAKERLQTAAEFLANIVKRQEEQSAVLQNGKLLQIGWNYFRVVENEGKYQLFALDYTQDPFQDSTPDLSLSLTYFQQQSEAVRRAEIQPVETTFQDTLIVETVALHTDKICMIRDSASKDGDSGWTCTSVCSTRAADSNEYVKAYTYQLRMFCEGAIRILHFPVHTIAVFEQGQLIEAVGRNNKKLL